MRGIEGVAIVGGVCSLFVVVNGILAICSVVLWDEMDEDFCVFVERINGLSTVGSRGFPNVGAHLPNRS